MFEMRGWRSVTAGVCVAMALAGCASKPHTPAPVEDRSVGARSPVPPAAIEPAKSLPGAENAGRPGYYTVRPGDTLVRIALDSGQNWRDVARWNNLDNPNVIDVGQVIRVIPPVAAPVEVASTRNLPPPAHAPRHSEPAARSGLRTGRAVGPGRTGCVCCRIGAIDGRDREYPTRHDLSDGVGR